jgi:hypothetical protein
LKSNEAISFWLTQPRRRRIARLKMYQIRQECRLLPHLRELYFRREVMMAIKKEGEPKGRLGNQGYQEGNQGREHSNPEGQRKDLDGEGGKQGKQVEPIGSEAKIKGHR